MIRRWFSAKPDTSVRNRQSKDSGVNQFGQFEQLEDKRCLAFVGFFDGVTLTLEQTFDDGDVVVDNSGIGGAFRVTDNAGTLSFVSAQNVIVEMLDNTANQINFNANNRHNGNVTIDAGHGPRDIQFTGNGLPGQANNITGDVNIMAGDSIQNILWTPVIGLPINIGGDFNVDTGLGFDTIFNSENFATVGGNVDLLGVNNFIFTDFLFPVPVDAFMTVGGNFTMDTSNESVESFYLDNGTFHTADPTDEERTVIGGNFTYIGGDDIDHVTMNNIYVQGNLDIDLGEGIPFFGDPQSVTTTLVLPRLLGGPYFELDGDAVISAGDANLNNVINLSGYHDGGMATFNMGGLTDIVNYNWIGTQVDVIADMGAGDDIFTLNQHVNSLIIDFGNDAGDEFVNNIGKFSFDADLLNFHWFDHIYTVGNDTLELTQLATTGDVTVDNTGGITGVAWRVSHPLGGVASTTPANNLILNMLDNTGDNVIIDLANPVLAFLTLNLGDGDRNVDFIGASNNPLRDINITADAGIQNVELSVNAPLAVATLNIDLGAGFDTVDDDANDLKLSEDLIFSGVNFFENDGLLSVGRNVMIDTTADSTDSIFGNNDQMIVAGTFTYTGGDGRDELRVNGASSNSIGGTTSVDLGGNIAGGTQMALFNAPTVFVGGNLTVQSSGVANDLFNSHANSTFFGNIFVDLADGANTAVITGAFSGTNVTYDGGDQVDTVTFGTTGNPANFNANLEGGDDTFTLLAGADIASPFIVNFGGNADTFINLYGPFDVDAELLGLNGFNHFFDLTDAKLTSTQISDQGDIVVDNNGTANSIRFTTGGSTSEIAPVNNLDINLLGGTGNNLDVDWDMAYTGDLRIDMGSSPRILSFTGDSNSISNDLTVTAGSGDQTVNLATTTNLMVGGDVSIDLGLNNDSLTDSGNDVNVGGDFTITGGNNYTNSGTMTVGGNLFINNAFETQASMFEDTGVMNVTGNFDYAGNSADDSVILDSLNAGATIGGDINVNLSSGNNTALLLNNSVGGTSVTYSGGGGNDLVELGLAGGPIDANVILGGGDDTFEIKAGVPMNSLFANFGTGNDTFINGNGPFNYPATLLGLNGFDHTFDPVGASLTSVQVESTGPALFDNNGPGGAIQVMAGGDTAIMGPISHLSVTMLDNSADDLTIDLDSALAGNLTVNLGDGNRALNLNGVNNSIGGGLNITGGSDVQTVGLALITDLSVGTNLDIDLGTGSDVLGVSGNNVNVPGNANINNVNQFTNDGVFTVGGDLSMDSSSENENTSLVDAAIMDITGSFTWRSGGGNDSLMMNASSSTGGDITVNTGNGDDTASIVGTFGGADIRYTGGTGADNVSLGTTGTPADVNFNLGSGDDTFTLDAGTAIATDVLRVNFGGGADTFDNDFGQFDFNATLLNLNGYNVFYNDASGNLDINQVADTGDLTIDDNGASNAIRFTASGVTSELTQATDLRLILLDNSSTDVTADFDATRNGNTTVQLRSGDRDVFFTGSSNTYNGLFRVEASEGVQNIHLAENANLNVTGTVIVNARNGNDTITAANPINVSSALLLRSVNNFTNNAGLSVGGDFNVITVLENQDTRLVNNASFIVGGNLTYLGGGGVDNINFKTNGATIGGFTYIDLATSTDLVNKQSIKLTGGFTTDSLVVDGGTAGAGNFFSTDAATFVDGGLVVVNFATSTTTNTAIFQGTYTGTYATYRGGLANDFVVVGANANNALFASLTGSGDDVLTVEDTTNVDFLYGDMGAGNDSLDNQFPGDFPFGNNIFNL